MHFLIWLKNSLNREGTIESDPRFPAMPIGEVFSEITGDISHLEGIDNFMIGDSDSIWPPGSVKKIVSKMAHPNNAKYTIFQGKVEPYNIDESYLTRFNYHVYKKYREHGKSLWKALKRSIFIGHGAGIKIDQFLTLIAGKMKDGFLSHDIVESIFAETGELQDTYTLESIPPSQPLVIKQWNRWWRGNRLTFVFFKKVIDSETGEKIPNPTSFISKYHLLIQANSFIAPLILTTMIFTNLILHPFIHFHSASTLQLIYFILVAFELYGSILVGERSSSYIFKSLKSLLMFVLLSPLYMVQISGFILKEDLIEIKNRITKNKSNLKWLPQASLNKNFGLFQAIWHAKYPILIGILAFTFLHQYMGFGLFYFFGSLIISPMLIYISSLTPNIQKNEFKAALMPYAQIAEIKSLAKTRQKHKKFGADQPDRTLNRTTLYIAA